MPPRMLFRPSVLLVAAFLFTTSAALAAEEAPPVSYDALLRIDKLPLLADWPAYQDSSYSRKDDNRDEGNFLRIEKNGEQVMVDGFQKLQLMPPGTPVKAVPWKPVAPAAPAAAAEAPAPAAKQ